jgi:hypothetical protein
VSRTENSSDKRAPSDVCSVTAIVIDPAALVGLAQSDHQSFGILKLHLMDW